MDIKFSKDAGDSPQQGGSGKSGNQNALLVVLLVLVAVFGYVYFFTGLIKPMQEQKVAEAPPEVQVVKKPLPSTDGKPVKTAEEGSAAKDEAAAPVKPEAVKAAAAPPAAEVKPVPQPVAKPKENLKKVEVAPTVEKKPLPVAAKAGDKKPASAEKKQAAVAEKKPVVVEKKSVIADKKPLPTKDGEKKIAAAKKPVEKVAAPAAAVQPAKVVLKTVKKVPAVSAEAAVSDRWTVLVGNYVLEEALVTDLGRVRSAGLEASIVPGPLKKSHMNRLLLAAYTDRASAQVELDKLKRSTSDAFVLDSAGMHMVYAGSYLLDARALSEKERLKSAGFNLTLKRADVSIPTKNLTAGTFADKKAAEETLKKLRAAGVKATLTR